MDFLKENLIEKTQSLDIQKSYSDAPTGFIKEKETFEKNKLKSEAIWSKETLWSERENAALDYINRKGSGTDEKKVQRQRFKTLSISSETTLDKNYYSSFRENNEMDFPESIFTYRFDRNALGYDLYYKGDDENVKQLLSDHGALFFSKNSLEFSPLIYSILGEKMRKDEEKSITKILVQYMQDRSAVPEEYQFKYSEIELENFILLQEDFKDVENELGHLILHMKDMSGLTIRGLIWKDLSYSLSYLIESLSDEKYLKSDEGIKMFKNICSLLSYSVEVKAINCSDLIIKFMIAQLQGNKKKCVQIGMISLLEKQISSCVLSTSENLPLLLEKLLDFQSKQLYTDPSKLPWCISIEKDLYFQNIKDQFYKVIQVECRHNEIVNVQIVNTIVKLPVYSGTIESLKILRNLELTKNIHLFKSAFIRFFIKYHWNNVWPFILFHSVLIWMNILIIFSLIFIFKDNAYLLNAFIVTNSLLALFEFIQLISSGFFNYFGNIRKYDGWVLIRFFGIGLSYFVNFYIFHYFIYAIVSINIFRHRDKRDEYSPLLLAVLGITSFLSTVALNAPQVDLLALCFEVVLLILSFPVVRLCFLTRQKKPDFNRFTCPRTFIDIIRALLILLSLYLKKNILELIIAIETVSMLMFILNLLIFFSTSHINKSSLIIDSFAVFIYSFNFTFPSQLSMFLTSLLTLSLSVFSWNLEIFYSKNLIPASKFQIFEIIITLISSILMLANPFQSLYLLAVIASLNMFHLVCYRLIYSSIFTRLFMSFLSLIFNWNTLDSTRLALCAVWIYNEYNQSPIKEVTLALVVLTLLRGLTGFRLFNKTRFYVGLIISTFKDITAFIVIFFYSTFAFGFMDAVIKYSNNDQSNLAEIWISSYELSLGTFDNEEKTLNLSYAIFMIATVFNVVVMINLLIAILGDSFDRFQLSSREIDYIEMTTVLAEVESFFYFRRFFDYPFGYLATCTTALESDKFIENIWEGKINVIEKIIKNEFSNLKKDISKKNGLANQIGSLEPLNEQSIQATPRNFSCEFDFSKNERLSSMELVEKNISQKLEKMEEIESKIDMQVRSMKIISKNFSENSYLHTIELKKMKSEISAKIERLENLFLSSVQEN